MRQPLFLCPGDIIKIVEEGEINSTLYSLSKIPENKLDETQKFLLHFGLLPKGTILKVGKLNIKSRQDPDNSVTFNIVDGPMISSYKKVMTERAIKALEEKVKYSKEKVKALSGQERTDELYEIKKLEKRISDAKKEKTTKGYTKVIKISLTDIESWMIKPAA